jgi:hypothetical protein
MRIDRYIRQREHDSRPEDQVVRTNWISDSHGKRVPVRIWAEKGEDCKILDLDTGEWLPFWAME